MAKSVDAQHLKCCDRKVMRVQVPPPAQIKNSQEWEFLICAGKKANCFAFGRDLKGGAMWVYEQASQGRERYIFREFTTIKIIDSWPSPILGTKTKLHDALALCSYCFVVEWDLKDAFGDPLGRMHPGRTNEIFLNEVKRISMRVTKSHSRHNVKTFQRFSWKVFAFAPEGA